MVADRKNAGERTAHPAPDEGDISLLHTAPPPLVPQVAPRLLGACGDEETGRPRVETVKQARLERFADAGEFAVAVGEAACQGEPVLFIDGERRQPRLFLDDDYVAVFVEDDEFVPVRGGDGPFRRVDETGDIQPVARVEGRPLPRRASVPGDPALLDLSPDVSAGDVGEMITKEVVDPFPFTVVGDDDLVGDPAHHRYPPLSVVAIDPCPVVFSPPMRKTTPKDRYVKDTMTDDFRLLASLLAAKGRFALPVDLMGIGGALFRFYWQVGGEEGERPFWSGRSAAVCSGDPLAAAAEAYGCRLSRGRTEARSEWEIVLVDDFDQTIGERIRFLRRSIYIGLERTAEEELRDGGLFAAGKRAYAALRSDLTRPPAPACALETEEALRTVLFLFGETRARLAIYLGRIGNFIDTSGGIGPFRKEGWALRRAADRLSDAGAGGLAGDRRLVKALRKDVGVAASRYEEGIDALHQVFSG